MPGIGVDIPSGGLATFSARVDIDPQKLAAYLRSPGGDVLRKFMDIGQIVKREAVHRAGRSTGALQDHMVVRVAQKGDSFVVTVGTDVPYALFHHEGSDAVNGKLMVFNPRRQGRMWYGPTRADGTVFITKRKAIPGTHFLTDALATVHI